MKKVLFAATALMIAASFSSCKKNYTCACTYSLGGITETASVVYNGTKSQATTDCNNYVNTVNNNYGVTASCAIQ